MLPLYLYESILSSVPAELSIRRCKKNPTCKLHNTIESIANISGTA